ncbi:MAG: guanylate kinase [Puniceicoccales bacterium]|jgi:guanylate kinase|nr:guanylate kinase [Puniceicoccales bacterium]
MGFGKIFIISGPAGIGKSTVCGRLVENYRGDLKRIVTTTTRKPRPGEVDGVDYCFIDEATFLKYIAEKKFLEYASVHRKYFYGTPIAQVSSNRRKGIDSLLIIDVHGAANIRKNFRQLAEHMVTIFIMPERLEVLTERLSMRGSEKRDDIAQRLQSAKDEIKYAKNYDYIVVSGSKDEDFISMQTIYEWEHSRSEVKPWYLIHKEKQFAWLYVSSKWEIFYANYGRFSARDCAQKYR